MGRRKILEEPLSPAELLDNTRRNRGRVRVTLALAFDQIACSSRDGTIEGMNDLAEELILGPDPPGVLADLTYAFVGFDPGGPAGDGLALVEVNAEYEPVDGGED